MSMNVVNPETALCILKKRSKQNEFGKDVFVNICGKVTCISEVFKLKDSLLFMVKFLPNVDVIIKMKEFLHWQEQLAPYREYIISDLRPTSLYKGSMSSYSVFTVTKSSRLLQPEDVDMKFVATSDWLDLDGIHDASDNESELNVQDPMLDNLFSYQGKVTAVLDRNLGVFELDNTVRLYVGPIPAAHKFLMLKEGVTVLVQNAHYTPSKQYPRVSLYCCMLASVRCMDSPSEKVRSVRLSQMLQKMLYLEGQSQGQLNMVFDLRQVLQRQFLVTFGERFLEKTFSTVIGYSELSGNGKAVRKRPHRVLIDEFLSIPHDCPLQKTDNVQVNKEQVEMSFRTIANVKDSISDMFNETMEWQHARQFPGKREIVFGILNLSESTGQVLLCDDTGSVEVVTCCYHGDREPVTVCDHVCTGTCNSDKLDIGDKFTCPYVQACCITKVVAVTKFEVVSETMVTRNASILKISNDGVKSRSGSEKYLLLDMRNVIYIGNSVWSVNVDNKSEVTDKSSDPSSGRDEGMHVRTEAKQNSKDEGMHVRTEAKQNGRDEGMHVRTEAKQNSRDEGMHVRTEAKQNGRDEGMHVRTEAKQNGNEMIESDIYSENVVQSVPDASRGMMDPVGHVNSDTKQETPVLHKHVRTDGTLMFCRKAGCCEVATKQCVESDVGSESNLASKNSINSAKENNKENITETPVEESGNQNVLRHSLGKSAFKVKPVNNRKRRVTDSHVDNLDEAELKKIPRTDLERKSVMNKEVLTGVDNESVEDIDCDNENCDVTSDRDVIVYVENKGSLMLEDKQHRFSMECTVVKKDGIEKTILEFLGKAVRWYPVLYTGAFYKLSVYTQDIPVLSTGLMNVKVQKMLQKSKTRKCFNVSKNVCVSRLWAMPLQSYGLLPSMLMSIKDILKPDFSEKFVSFEGWILNRTLVKPGFAPKSVSKDTGAAGMYSKLHVQDSSRCEDIWVYLNDNTIVSERGLIPGSRVMFYRLERKLSQLNNIYCRLVPLSSVKILCLEPARGIRKHQQNSGVDMKQLPLLYLVDVWSPSNAGKVFHCVCAIEKILKVSLKCLCETCGSLVVKDACSNTACSGDGGYRFLARASAIIDDSTSVGMVTLTGSGVQSVLQLSHGQWKCLEEEVSLTGEVFVQQFNPNLCTSLERFVYKLCDNHAVKQTWSMTLRTKSALDINKIGYDEFCVKSFDTGSSRISTQCLPFLQLDCLDVKVFEPSVWSVHHLSKSSGTLN